MFASLASRNFRLFFVGQTISQVGNWMTMVALTLLILRRTDSGMAIGLLSACQFGPVLLFSAWAGLIADRSNKRNLLMLTQALAMCQSAALGVLAFMDHAPIGAFYVVAFIGGLSLAVDNPVRRPFVNELVPIGDVANAVSLYSAMNSLARIAGPTIAGVLIVTVGFGWTFTIDAVSYVAVLGSLALMRPDELRRAPRTPRGAGQVREGLRYITGVPELWITFAMLLIIGLISYNFSVTFPLFVVKALHGSDRAYTLVYAAFSAGGLVGALVTARRSVVTITNVARAAAGLGASMLVLAFVPNPVVAAAVAVAVGAMGIGYMTGTTAIAQLRADNRMLGRVLAVQMVLLIGTTPIGGPILGAVADALGARAPVLIGGVGALAAAAFGTLAARRFDQTSPTRPETTTTPGTRDPPEPPVWVEPQAT
ncbi:MFS transporter [Candidatus Microthrix sp.]|uniref:MFS transporter n=1 Tax=Candidatus Neomicrothrix sp. TaxID=2719034 RepID=UPI002284C25C|nr:MFS transporter [Candidatus Microthrix sp.]